MLGASDRWGELRHESFDMKAVGALEAVVDVQEVLVETRSAHAGDSEKALDGEAAVAVFGGQLGDGVM